MSFCVLSNDDKVCVVETHGLEFDFSSVPQNKKLKNRAFEYKSVQISVLFFSGIQADDQLLSKFGFQQNFCFSVLIRSSPPLPPLF